MRSGGGAVVGHPRRHQPRLPRARRYPRRTDEARSSILQLRGPTAHIAWSPAAQANFAAPNLALFSVQVLRTLEQHRRAALTTDSSGVAVAAILKQPDDEPEGLLHQVAYERSETNPIMCWSCCWWWCTVTR